MKRCQSILKYIPFVNIICVFQLLVCLWKNSFYIHAKEKYSALFRPMLVLLGINIPVIIARSYLTNATVVYIVNILDAFISLYVWAEMCIREQKRIEEIREQRKNG